MYSANIDIKGALEDFMLEGATFPYNGFVARLYNFCRSLGFEPGKILPSRAFCSDETQGYPSILIAKHFGAFPFNHGRVGGIVATDRHGPHAHHGKDLLIIHASHVGYDSAGASFGQYHRSHTEHSRRRLPAGKSTVCLSGTSANMLLLRKISFSIVTIKTCWLPLITKS